MHRTDEQIFESLRQAQKQGFYFVLNVSGDADHKPYSKVFSNYSDAQREGEASRRSYTITECNGGLTRETATTLLGILAILLIVIGAGMVFYFMLIFDTSVEAPGVEALGIASGRVNNIGLMADRQNGIVCGFGLVFFGVIAGMWDYFTRMKRDER